MAPDRVLAPEGQNRVIPQSLVDKLLHSLDRSDREQARTAGAVLVITISSDRVRAILASIASISRRRYEGEFKN